MNMQLYFGKLAKILKETKDEQKNLNKEVNKLELSKDHNQQMFEELTRISKTDNDFYLEDIEAVLKALSDQDLSDEIELLIQNYIKIKEYFTQRINNYNIADRNLDPIQIRAEELFISDFTYSLDDDISYIGQDEKFDITKITNSVDIQTILGDDKDIVLLEYNPKTGKSEIDDTSFNYIIGKWVNARYNDTHEENLYTDKEKAKDIGTLTTLLISFYTFIQEEKDNFIEYIKDYKLSIDSITEEIKKVNDRILSLWVVIGSIIKEEDLYYTNSETQAKRLIYKSYNYYKQINDTLQEIVDRHNLNIEFKHNISE